MVPTQKEAPGWRRSIHAGQKGRDDAPVILERSQSTVTTAFSQTRFDRRLGEPVHRARMKLGEGLARGLPVAEALPLHEQEEVFPIAQRPKVGLAAHCCGIEQRRTRDLTVREILGELAQHPQLPRANFLGRCDADGPEPLK